MNRLLRTRPVAGFALLAFAIAYGVGLPLQIALSTFLPWLDATAGYYLGRVFVVGAPAIAAFLLSRAAGDGHTQQWLAQLHPTPIALRWMPVAIAGGAAIITIAFLLDDPPPHALQSALSQEWRRLLLLLLLEFLIVGIGEELGWRGWLLPTLLSRGLSPLGASLCVGMLWGAWHVPVLFQGPSVAVPFMVTTVSLSMLQTALWLRTSGSVLTAAAAHAACNATLATLPGSRWPSVALVASLAAIVAAAVTFRKTGSE